MKRPTLRSMLLVPILVTVTFGLIGFAAYVRHSVRQDLVAGVDSELVRAERSGQTRRATAAPRDRVVPERDNRDTFHPPVYTVLGRDGAVRGPIFGDNPFSASDFATLARLTDGNHTYDEPSFRVRITTQPDGSVAVTALNLAEVNAAAAKLDRALLGGALVILVLEVLVVWLATSFLTRPLTRMAAAARRVASGELDTYVDQPSGSRETAALSEDLTRMLGRLQSTVAASRRSADAATRSRDDLQRFLADAAHELRTPLTALKGYSDLYAGNMLSRPDDVDRAMSRIGSESARMARLVNDMLQLARNGTISPAPTAIVDLGDVVAGVVDDLRAAYPDAALEFIPPEVKLDVRGDRGQIHQAILNIGANACQHGPPETLVRIEARGTDHDALILISDDGPGIAPHQADQVFLPFFRADASRSRDRGSGAGLGLAITKQIIDRHGGSIAVRSTPGGGATFVVTLPLASRQAAPVMAASRSTSLT